MIPRIQLVAYESRNPEKVFVAIPDIRGHYLMTHRCVAIVGCPQCLAPPGVPCTGSGGRYTSSTHYVRRNKFHSEVAPKPHAPDVIGEQDENQNL